MVVTATSACLWTDGRYFAHAERQLTAEWTLMKLGDASTPSVGEFLNSSLPAGAHVGFDPLTTGLSTYRRWAVDAGHCVLTPTQVNLVDLVWNEPEYQRPPRHAAPVLVQPLEFAGLGVSQKIATVRTAMAPLCSAHIVTALDCICWLLNLRGSDIPYNPVFLAYVVVELDAVTLYVFSYLVSINQSQHPLVI